MNTSAVVVGVDGSPRDHVVLDVAVEWAGEWAEIVIVHVNRPPVAWYAGVSAQTAAMNAVEEVAGDCQMMVELLLARSRVAWSFLVRHGDPADELLGVAEMLGAGCIVVGGSSAGPVRRVLMGTVAGRLLRLADRPVLVVAGPRGHPSTDPESPLPGHSGVRPRSSTRTRRRRIQPGNRTQWA